MVSRFQQHHLDLGHVEVAEVFAQHEPDQLRVRAGELHAGRAAAHHDERQHRAPFLGRLRPARRFEPRQDPVAQGERLVEALQPQRVTGQRLVAEEVRLRAEGEDQEVVGQRPVVRQQEPPLQVGARHLGLPELDVAQRPSQLANRPRDLAGVEQRRRHLVQQRREEMEVVAVDQQHVHVDPLQGARARDPGEAGARDDDARSARQL